MILALNGSATIESAHFPTPFLFPFLSQTRSLEGWGALYYFAPAQFLCVILIELMKT